MKGPAPRPLKNLNGVFIGNIVIEYFVRGFKKFSDIVRA
jgi:hypothetical protein